MVTASHPNRQQLPPRRRERISSTTAAGARRTENPVRAPDRGTLPPFRPPPRASRTRSPASCTPGHGSARKNGPRSSRRSTSRAAHSCPLNVADPERALGASATSRAGLQPEVHPAHASHCLDRSDRSAESRHATVRRTPHPTGTERRNPSADRVVPSPEPPTAPTATSHRLRPANTASSCGDGSVRILATTSSGAGLRTRIPRGRRCERGLAPQPSPRPSQSREPPPEAGGDTGDYAPALSGSTSNRPSSATDS